MTLPAYPTLGQNSLLRFSAAVVGVVLAFVLTYRFEALWTRTPFSLFYASVAFASWFGGRRCGWSAFALSVAAGAYLISRTPDGTPPEISIAILQMTVFVTVGLYFVFLISQMQAAELSVGESEERYRTLFRYSPHGVLIADEQSTYIDANEKACQMLGYTRNELVGLNAVDIVAPDQTEQVHGVLDALRSGRDHASEWLFQRKDGSSFVGEVVATMMPDRTLLGVVQDITDRKAAEEENRELRNSLELRVAERTSELEAANKELESFSYSVSHDLRAPLRHIEGFVKLLVGRENEHFDETSQRYVKVISNAVEKMNTLIEELLSFSRTSRKELQTTTLDLADMVRETIPDMEPETEGRNVEWKIGPLPRVEGDATLIGLVLTNLISNAVKFTRNREKAVIEIGRADDSEGRAVVFIKDNGVGFDMVYSAKLFGVFQRLHRDEEFKGVGIGLATVQRIINRHGGRVWAEAAVGQGATFYFALKEAGADIPEI